jgi:hypothetical protein
MAYQAGEGEKKQVPQWAIIVAAVAVLAFMVWWGIRNFGPQPDPANDLTRAQDQWMDRIAKESGGDISKIAPEDLKKLQRQTYGHADLALKAFAQKHGYAK